jgi:DNA-binding NarL/FixJ family response regulator
MTDFLRFAAPSPCPLREKALMRDDTSPVPAPGQYPEYSGYPATTGYASSHTSTHTSSHSPPLHSEHTPSHVQLPPLPAPFPEPVAPTTLRVVVADDNPVVRAGLTALLDGCPDLHVVAEAADGRQALAAAHRHRPDVVLLDVRMPGVDGISALPHLVQVAPVMMLTYSRESEIVQEALRLGAGGYLVHGEFTADQLVAAVRDIKEGRAHFTSSAQTALLAHVRGELPPGGERPLPESLGEAWGDRGANAHGNAERSPGGWQVDTDTQARPVVSNSLHPRQIPSQMQPLVAQSSSEQQQRQQQRQRQWGATAPPNRAAFGLSSREVEVMDLIASGMSNQQIAATCFISEKTVKNHINRIFAKLHSVSRSEAIAVWLGTTRGIPGHG